MAEGLERIGLRITTSSATAYAQSFGFAVEVIPVGEAKAAKIKLATLSRTNSGFCARSNF